MDHKYTVFGSHQQQSVVSSTTWSKSRGTKAVRDLVNSIARFSHLASCRTIKCSPIQKDYRDMVSVLRALKPVLDEVTDAKISFDPSLLREFEGLDIAVNEAKDLLEKWGSSMSKIYTVLYSGQLLVKFRSSSLEICYALSKLQQFSSFPTESMCVQHCIQELKCVDHEERTSELVDKALRCQGHRLLHKTDHLLKIVESLCLTSNQELLSESMALERLKAELLKSRGEMMHIDQIIDLLFHIRDFMLTLEQYKGICGIPIPSHFRCPLSLELMMDPVIVASGQTYERSYIQKWIDQGLRICPKSRRILSHTNMIPNHTVKALIASWCVDNNIKCLTVVGAHNVLSGSKFQRPRDELSRVDSYHDSLYSGLVSPSSIDASDKLDFERVTISSVGEEDTNPTEMRTFCHTSNQKVVNYISSKWEPLNEKSYGFSRSESVGSVISSLDDVVSRESSRCDHIHEVPEFVLPECQASPSNKDLPFSSTVPGTQFLGSNKKEVSENQNGTHYRSCSSVSDSTYGDLMTYLHVQKLIEDLTSQSNEVQTAAAAEIRLLTKHDMENRLLVAKGGAIMLLIPLLYSEVNATQENAVAALLNLSINDKNKSAIAEAGAIEPLIHILKTGTSEARENSAATLFSLSVLGQYKIKIGRSAAVKALVDLLGSGTLRGKKDAATALFNLSIFHENKARIVQGGAVKHLVELMAHTPEMVDKSVALLANLATVPDGRTAITREGGIPFLVEVVESGSQRGKENAASALLQLCLNSQKFCTSVLQEGAVPPLVALSQSGTPRAKEKAQQLLSHFRSQRGGNVGKGKS